MVVRDRQMERETEEWLDGEKKTTQDQRVVRAAAPQGEQPGG